MAHNLPFQNRNGTIYISTAANPVLNRAQATEKGQFKKNHPGIWSVHLCTNKYLFFGQSIHIMEIYRCSFNLINGKMQASQQIQFCEFEINPIPAKCKTLVNQISLAVITWTKFCTIFSWNNTMMTNQTQIKSRRTVQDDLVKTFDFSGRADFPGAIISAESNFIIFAILSFHTIWCSKEAVKK